MPDRPKRKRRPRSEESVEQQLGIEQLDEHTPNLNLGIYGDSGVGKTVLACSINQIQDPQIRELWLPALILDSEHGTWSVRDRTDIQRTGNVGYSHLARLSRWIRSGKSPYKTIIMDSATDIQRVLLTEIINERMKEKPQTDPDEVERGDWGKLATRFRKVIRTYRDLEVNLIITALAREYEDDEAPSRTTLALSGQMRAELPAFLDVVCYMQIESRRIRGKRRQRRVLRPQPTARYVAKDRSWVLGDVVVNPTMDKIVTKIYRERGLLNGTES